MRPGGPPAAHRIQRASIQEREVPQWKKWALAAALAASAGGWLSPAAGVEPLKVGFIYVSPIGDAGWTFQHDTGRKEMEKALVGR